jgi:energy-coupling factor transport system ATP-binding protein
MAVGMMAFATCDLQTLSGGEKQKIALATVIALDSDVIVLDEPFANVDEKSRCEILKLLKMLQDDGKTILVADHDLRHYQHLATNMWEMADQHVNVLTKAKMTQRLTTLTEKPALVLRGKTKAPVQLEIRQLTLQQAERRLLNTTTLSITKGQRILLTGDNGVGKSTLFAALMRLKRFEGNILYKGSTIHRVKHYVQEVNLVFQQAQDQFLYMTVAEEIAHAVQFSRYQQDWTEARVEKALKKLQLEAVLQQNVHRLSGGQQRKLQVLIMLIHGAPIVLLDEPLGSLDGKSQRVLLSLIDDVTRRQQQTVLMISHQLSHLSGFFDAHWHLSQQQIDIQEGEAHAAIS